MNRTPDDSSNKPKYIKNSIDLDDCNLIGRETELKKLLRYVSSDYRQHITVVNGVDGIGKTALVSKVANLCQNYCQKPKYLSSIKTPKFVAVIFVSIKKSYFDFDSRIRQVCQDSALQYIFRKIASDLKLRHDINTSKINRTSGEEQIQEVYQCLNKQYTLLIIDNLDAARAKEKDYILFFLSNLPTNVQAIITTRDQGFSYSPVSLEPLSKKEGLQLIQQQEEKKIVKITNQEAQEIYNSSGGIPLAIIYAVGYREVNQKIKVSQKNHYSFVKSILEGFSDNKAHFLFKKLQELLKDGIEQKLLISISFFPEAPAIEAIYKVAGLELYSSEIKQGLKKLEKLSLIQKQKQSNQYSVCSITREYIAKETTQHYNFEKNARVRWVKWHLQLVDKHGGKDWKNWRSKYDQLEKEWNNLLAVLEWCAGQEHYESVRDLWKGINQFANLYGYWNDRIFWLTWLIEESTKRGEWKTASYCMSEKGFTLIQMRNFKEAKLLLKEAFSLVKTFELSNKQNLENQILICQHFALLYLKQEKYKPALYWLEEEKKCAKEISDIRPREYNRRKIAIDTLEAEILLGKESYVEAKRIYEKIVKESAQIGWERRTNYAQEQIESIQLKLLSVKFRRPPRPANNSKNKLTKNKKIEKSSFDHNLANRNLAG
ncbi:MAG: ATP-binding protein [Cyanobacteria bacterium P01_G01_bin.39]